MVLQTLQPIQLQPQESFFKKYLSPKSKEILAGETTLKKEITRFLTGAAITGAAIGTALIPGAAPAVGSFVARRPLAALIGVPTAATILLSSEKARSFIDPRETVKRAKKVAEIIEDPSKAVDILGIKEKKTLKEKVITGLKAAGFVGAAAAVAIGGVAALKKGKAILDKRKAAKLAAKELKVPSDLGFTPSRPVGLGGVPIIQPPGVPGAVERQPAISNIIQISLR